MVQVYQKRWRRGMWGSAGGYLRDLFVYLLPVKRLPSFLIRLLYGIEADFAFLVHARNYQDVFISAPYLKPIKFFLRKPSAYQFLASLGPFVVSRVRTSQGVHGIVVGRTLLPEFFLRNRKRSLLKLAEMIRFASKITKNGAVVGLGAWFSMFTKRGLAVQGIAKNVGLRLTNGHMGTLISIYLTLERIASLIDVPLSGLHVAVIGTGKMGENVAHALNGKVASLTLIDIQLTALEKTRRALLERGEKTQIKAVLSEVDGRSLREALKEVHIGICATSTFRNLLKLRDMPSGFVAIDDSRPEALPRDPRGERIILEGGLLKIKGAVQDYDYGFGENENVFGCLGESFLLAYDGGKTIQPTLGRVDMLNFERGLELCRRAGVCEGDFKSSEISVSGQLIKDSILSRLNAVNNANK